MKTVLITGASGGIGRRTVEAFADRGWTVFASDRSEPPPRVNVHPLVLDVTDEASVARAREQIEALLGGHGLDVLVNNAGLGLMGPIVELRDEDARRMWEVNVLGVARVSRAFVPLLALHAGRIVNLGSLAGICTLPFLGAYCATKHAVEAITDAMRIELEPIGIRVSLVQPAIVNTGFVDNAILSLKGSALERVGRLRAALAWTQLEPEVVADTVYRAATQRRPRARYPVGFIAAATIRILRWLPVFVSDRALRFAASLRLRDQPAPTGFVRRA